MSGLILMQIGTIGQLASALVMAKLGHFGPDGMV